MDKKRGFGSLVKNEIIKILAQTGYRVVIIILMALVVITPFISRGIEALFSLASENTPDAAYKNAEQMQENYNILDENDIDPTAKELGLEYFGVIKESAKLFMGREASEKWKFNTFYGHYREIYLQYKAFELIASGKNSFSEVYDSLFGYSLISESEITENVDDYVIGEDSNGDRNVNKDSDFKALYNAAAKYLKELQNKIKTITAGEYAEESSQSIRNTVRILEEQKAENDKNPAKNDEEKFRHDALILSLSSYKRLLEAAEYICQNNIAPDDERFALVFGNSNGASKFMLAVADTESYTVPTKEYYESAEGKNEQHYVPEVYSYDEYRKLCVKNLKNNLAAIEMYSYSVKNGVVLPDMASSPSKTIFRLLLSTNMNFVTVVMIIIASMIVSSEYSHGTIRLLLIRPRSRVKILASKYATLAIVGAVMSIAAWLVTSLLTAVLFGVGDMLVPNLVWHGKAVAVPSVLYSLWRLLLMYISSMLFATVGFFFSTLTKKSPLSIVLALVVNSLGAFQNISIVFALRRSSTAVKAFLDLTVLPYMHLDMLLATPADIYVSTSGALSTLSGIIGIISRQIGVLALDVNIIVGIVVVLIHIAVMLTVSALSFKSHQVKS